MKLDIVTMDRPIVSVDIRSVIVRTMDGELAVMPGHTALMALIAPCVVRIQPRPGAEPAVAQRLFVSGGLLEVQPDQVSILAEKALFAEEIDIEQAREALIDALARQEENFLVQDRQRARVEAMSAQAQVDLWQWGQAAAGRFIAE